MYNDFDDDLFQRRISAKKLFRKYNKTEDDETELRKSLMNEMFKSVGENTLLGPNVGIYPVNHATDAEERINGGCYGKPVHIGKRVWIGGDVKILAGVSIGDDTIIGTGSIVTKDIPSGVIAVGNPCKVIRKITDADKTDYLK